jgi:aminoglycoside phosphotransferase (APT) family kinase protein
MLPAPSDDEIRQILRKHGFPADEVVRATTEGVANAVYLAGEIVVRIGINPEYWEDTYREPITVTIGLETGVPMAKLLFLDDDRDVFPGPLTIYERRPGITATRVILRESFYAEFGQQIATLHNEATRIVDDRLEPPSYRDAIPFIEESVKRNRIPEEEGQHFRSWFDSLRPAFDQDAESVFLHNDLHLGNLLATEDGAHLTAILDWSDAGWGDPAIDFRYIPATSLEVTIERYRRHRPEVDDTFEGRVLSEVIASAFAWIVRHDRDDWLVELRKYVGCKPAERWTRWHLGVG